MKYFYQVSVDSAAEAAEFEDYLGGLGYDVEVTGPYAIALFDLKDVDDGTLVRVKNVYVITGTMEKP